MDHFKRVNDLHGHGAGDAVLRGAARAIEAAVRPTGLAARYGVEEFCVLLPETPSAEEIMRVAERIRLSVMGRSPADCPDLRVTASIGGALWEARSAPASALAGADQTVYQAKEAGRNNVQLVRSVAQMTTAHVPEPARGPDPGAGLGVGAYSSASELRA